MAKKKEKENIDNKESKKPVSDKKGTGKVRSDKYDPKLKIKGSFEDVMKALIGKKEKK